MIRVLLFLLVSLSCASKTIIPTMEKRTLFLDPDKPSIYYNICKKRAFFSNKCKRWEKEEWDLTKKKDREKLINYGFKLRVFRYN